MLHIAECTDTFLPISDGVGRVVYEYARSLSGMGEAVYVVTPQGKAQPYRGSLPFEVVDYYAMQVPGMDNRRYGVAVLDRHYVNRMNDVPLDLVHVHSPGSAGLEACRLADQFHVPLIGTFHPKYFEDVYRYVRQGGLAEAAVRRVAEFYLRCDAVWTISPQSAAILRDAGYTGPVDIVPSGTDLSPVPDGDLVLVRERFHLGNTPILLCVGSIDFSKNWERAIQAAAILTARNIPFQMLFVGAGPDEQQARQRVRELGLSGIVRFLGHIYEDRILRALYAVSSLNIFPSLYITAGLVIHEAAAVGVPSLAIRGSSAAEPIQEGINGLLSEDNAGDMANVIQAALTDPVRLVRMGAAARASIPTSWETVMNEVSERYRAITREDRHSLKIKSGFFREERKSVDETLEMRMVDMASRFLRQDMQHVYAYPRSNPIQERLPAITQTNLPRATPESQGLSSKAILHFLEQLDRDPSAHVSNLMILRHGKVVTEAAWAPYEKHLPRQLYSLSKSVTSTAIGLLVEDGLLDLDERVMDILEYPAQEPPLPSAKFTVRHLLTMSTGSLFNELCTPLTADWIDGFFRAGVKFEPGTAFEYNSLNTYMLSAIVQKRSGKTMTAFLSERLYHPLGIAFYDWETCPRNIEKGGWGLMLTLEDVAKLGQLYLNGGQWEGKQIVSRHWIREASTKQIETPLGEMPHGYGYQIWMAPHPGGFMFNGAFGQYMIALPDQDAVIALFSCSAKLFAKGNIMSYVDELFSHAQSTAIPVDGEQTELLKQRLSSLSVSGRHMTAHLPSQPISLQEAAIHLKGRVYTMKENVGGLFPVPLQCVHNNFSLGLSQVVFAADGRKNLKLTFREGNEQNVLSFDPLGKTEGTVSIRGEKQRVAGRLICEDLEGGNFRLKLCLHFIETPFTKLVTMDLTGDRIRILLDDQPSVQDATWMLLDLAGITRLEFARKLIPVLQAEKLQQRLRTYTTVTAEGEL